jgi:hypothetical protein
MEIDKEKLKTLLAITVSNFKMLETELLVYKTVSQQSEKAQQRAQDAAQSGFGHPLGIIEQSDSDARAALPVPSGEVN